jgi:hypothetical protein
VLVLVRVLVLGQVLGVLQEPVEHEHEHEAR